MRLSEQEKNWIKETIYHMDSKAQIHLFGSRIYDDAEGGDIDLLILSKTLGLKEKLIIRYTLKEKFGNRKIDLIVTPKPNNAFTRMAFKNSLLL